jgi:hypothetical protein
MATSRRLGSVLGFAVAATWIGTMAPCSEALAQAAGTVSIKDVFPVEVGAITPTPEGEKRFTDAAKKANAPGECPKATVKIVMKKGEPLFQESVAAVRRDNLRKILDRAGLNANRFQFERDTNGKADDVQIDYDASRDREKPKLATDSEPRKGSKVTGRTKIKVTMVARDDANRWQSGIQSIQLLAESDGNRSVKAENWPPRPQTCEHAPEPRQLVAIYEVPRNPPPIVRLRAITEDFVGHYDTDVAEFPTGDWYGRLEWSMRVGPAQGWSRFFGTADLAVSVDGRDGLAGTILGSASMEGFSSECPHVRTLAPTIGRARLVGSYTPGADTMTLAVQQVETVSKGRISKCMGTELPAPTAEFALLLHTNRLQKRADNTFYASGTTQSGSRFSLTLFPANH